MPFPTEKCTFLQKNALSRRKMWWSGGHMAGNRRKFQEGFRAQESRTLANFHKIWGPLSVFWGKVWPPANASNSNDGKYLLPTMLRYLAHDFSGARFSKPTQRALRDILMPRGKTWRPNCLAAFLTRNYPHPNCLLECLRNCLSPTREDFFCLFQTCACGEGNCAGNFCLAAFRCLSGPSAKPLEGQFANQRRKTGHFWGIVKGCSISWVTKLKGDKTSECKLPNGWSRSYREIKLLLLRWPGDSQRESGRFARIDSHELSSPGETN